MRNKVDTEMNDELRPEYDLSQLKGGVRGKYMQRYNAGTNLVLLAPDVAEAFPTDEAVNESQPQQQRRQTEGCKRGGGTVKRGLQASG